VLTGQELRPLLIPAVRDRVVGAAAKLVIEPVFEADFLPCSFGFCPKRSQHDALQVLIDQSWKGRRWALETDIANCFEAISALGVDVGDLRNGSRTAVCSSCCARCCARG
jgi:retron-type reverse transcriptase